MQRFLLLIFAVLLFKSECLAQKAKAKIDSILIFPPLTEINIIRIGNKAELDSALSGKVSSELIKQSTAILTDEVKVNFIQANTSQVHEIKKAIAHIIDTAERKFKPKKINAPGVFLHLLDSANLDYGLGIAYIGYNRTTKNQSDEYLKRVGLSLLASSLLGDVTHPGILHVKIKESLLTTICFIVDRKQKTVLFYQKSTVAEINPANTVVIKSQLYHLIMSFFL